MAYVVRGSYSNPPQRGAKIIAKVLLDKALNQAWRQEVDEMRQRIQEMRRQLVANLTLAPAGQRFKSFFQRRGMFVTTGLLPAELDQLRTNFGIYLVQNGRLCLAGLRAEHISHVGRAILNILEKRAIQNEF